MKNKLPAWAVLTLISLVAAILLGATYELTKDTIAQRALMDAENTRRTLLPEADVFELMEDAEGLDTLYAGKNASDDTVVGYVATATVTGFGGEIEITLGMNQEGVLTGIRVGGANFSETAGLGARAKEASFTDQFAGLTAPVTLGEDIDTITSATITTNAVIRGVNSAADGIFSAAGLDNDNQIPVGRLENGRYFAQTQGFGGPVYVEVALDESGVITDISIGNNQFRESPGYGQKAQEPAFYEQFLGISQPVALNADIDAVTSATITSTAVVDAVNLILTFAQEEQ